jgi:hypothetical protein
MQHIFLETIPEPILKAIRVDRTNWKWYKKFFSWRTSRRNWEIQEDWIVYIDYLKTWVKIPAGFVTDGASVPKILNSFVSSTDILFYAAVIHDFIYRFNTLIVWDGEKWILSGPVNKTKADHILFFFSKQTEGMWFPNGLSTLILFAFGFVAWCGARKRNIQLKTPNPDFDDKILKSSKGDVNGNTSK